VEEAAEGADGGDDLRAAGGASQVSEARDEALCGVDIDAGCGASCVGSCLSQPLVVREAQDERHIHF
jgi:hypothetical protein